MRNWSSILSLSFAILCAGCGDGSQGSNTATGSSTGSSARGGSASVFPQSQERELPLGPFEGDELDEVVAAHNDVRTELGLDPMEWVDSLAIIAANWADQCLDENGDHQIDHNVDLDALGVGENIWTGTVSREGTDAVEAWIAEVDDYDYEENTCAPDAMCGHYTQVVWDGTNQVGCARAFCDNLEFQNVIVCNYRPPGNIQGEKPY